MLRHLLIIVIFSKAFLVPNVAQAQDHKIGFMYGAGNQEFLFLTYEYKVQLFQPNYSYTVWRKNAIELEITFIPQFNLTKYRPVDNEPLINEGYEYGLNAGLILRKSYYKDIVSFYVGGSIGPHYITGAPIRQTSGFIFSDNLFIGMSAKLDKNLYLDIRPGFRHISNANIVKPNRGINNLIINAGLFVVI